MKMHVKVDNWGIYFLQRLKHFFNRTDYCDLTLQFQDSSAQLKVHRLVLSACTEYFELLERTCEMYEDCLVMPDDLQEHVVVPIINFMYTGQLEFHPDLLEKLYQASLVMNVPVLLKLLDTHRQNLQKPDVYKTKKIPVTSSSGMAFKRSSNKTFVHDSGHKSKKMHSTFSNRPESSMKNGQQNLSDSYNFHVISERNKHLVQEPRPTRCELPEELDEDNVFDNSFTSISYTSKPLMVHPDTVKQYGSKKSNLFEDASSSKRFFRGNPKPDVYKTKKMLVAASSGMAFKHSFNKAFEHNSGHKSKKMRSTFSNRPESSMKNGHQSLSDSYNFRVISERNKHLVQEPRPARYELPEELDENNVFDNSFTSISYTSKPLMVHPDTVKQYGSKKSNLFEDASSSKRIFRGSSNDTVECRKISMNTNLFDKGPDSVPNEDEIFRQPASNKENIKDASQLFNQIIESKGPKLTIKRQDCKQVDHAKIIKEVLKKYPHLMKSNRNIKVKILDTLNKCKKKSTVIKEEKETKPKQEPPDFTYQMKESDVIHPKEAARLNALGAENIHWPWICHTCGTPGKALHFPSYYRFRRHLVDVHNEQPVSTICEYCGLKSLEHNYLLYHLYTKHGVEPPSNYNFPKCNYCNYIALTEDFLVKHKKTEHIGFRCNVCASTFSTSNHLLVHIYKTGHKYSANRKENLQCIYCLKVFLREANLYTHLKTNHKQAAKTDGIIDNSEEEKFDNEEPVPTENLKSKQNNETLNKIKYEVPVSMDSSYEGVHYQFEEKEDGNIVSKKPKLSKSRTPSATKHKILNAGFKLQNLIIQPPSKTTPKKKDFQKNNPERKNFMQESNMSSLKPEEVLIIDNKEYIIQNNQIIPKKERNTDDYSISNTVSLVEQTMAELAAETLLEFQNLQTVQPQTSRMIVKKNSNLNQPIQIVFSNEEEYKALMASNHSIFFEDGDPNKTLTVLTAQTNTPIETNTDDFERSQSNEMMIIPDNYPMSVAETVTADNSNIVVFKYSHPIDDQNKQYHQHVTSRIERQFIQSSAIITQNFETITTCTPVMSAHVIDTPVEETWQNNINENINKLPISSPQTTIAAITPVESNTSNSLNELSEIQLPATKEILLEINQQEIVTSNEVYQTVNIYNQPEGTQSSQCIVNESNTDALVPEGDTNDIVLTSQTQSDIVNSLDLLEQNVMTGEIQPQSNIIINNSTQMNLSVLSTVSQLCHTTDNDPNNDNVIASNIEIDDTVSVVEEHEESQTTESTINNDRVADNPILTHESQEDQMVDPALTNNSQEVQLAGPITTDECQQSQTVEHQKEIAQEESNNRNSVTIEVQHMQQCENLIIDKQVSNIPHNSESENKAETIENIANDIGVDPDSVEQNMEMIHMTVNSEPVTADITKSVTPNINCKDDIQNLTSEWSVEESEIPQEQEQDTNTNPNLQKSEIEESIENIQHEINKHLATSAELDLNKGSEIKKSSNQNEIASQNKTPYEKISSLLNDLDDNNSEEEDINTKQPSEEKSLSENEI